MGCPRASVVRGILVAWAKKLVNEDSHCAYICTCRRRQREAEAIEGQTSSNIPTNSRPLPSAKKIEYAHVFFHTPVTIWLSMQSPKTTVRNALMPKLGRYPRTVPSTRHFWVTSWQFQKFVSGPMMRCFSVFLRSSSCLVCCSTQWAMDSITMPDPACSLP